MSIKITKLSFDDIIPSTQQPITLHPFTVKEEKILLLMKNAKDDTKLVVKHLKELIKNCIEEEIDVDVLTTYDIEHIFIKLKIISIGETSDIIYKCSECDKENNIKIDLTKSYLSKDENQSNDVYLKRYGVGFKMKHPNIMRVLQSDEDNYEDILNMIAHSIISVYNDDEIDEVKDSNRNEIIDMLTKLSLRDINQLTEYIHNIPRYEYDLQFTCKHCKAENQTAIKGIMDFF